MMQQSSNMRSTIEKQLIRLATQLGGSYYGGYAHVSRSGCSVAITMYSSIAYSSIAGREGVSPVPARLIVATKLASKTHFAFTREGILKKILKGLRIVKEYESGYEEFDRKFLLKIDNKELARRLFSEESRQNIIAATLDGEFTRIYTDENQLIAEKVPLLSFDVSANVVSVAIDCIINLAEFLKEEDLSD